MSDDVDALMGDLMNKISTITTEEPEELLQAFSELTGCDRQLCTFFLEANRWNLQSAIISYFDTGGQTHQEAQEVPSMCLVADISDSSEANAGGPVTVQCNSEFTKTWRLKNNGSSVWPVSFLTQSQTLHQNTVELLQNLVPVPRIGPGEMCDVTALLNAPLMPGECVGVLRLVTAAASIFFGDEIWVLCNVFANPNEPVGVDMSNLSVDSGMDMS